MSSITVRQAVLNDLDELTPLFDAYRQFYGQQSDVMAASVFLLSRFVGGESTLFIAHDGATAIGFTQLYPSFSSVSMARIFILNDLFVLPAQRNKGAASELMAAATAYGKSVGAKSLCLSTAVTNTAAQSLYQASGWKRDDEFFVYELPLTAEK